MVSVWRTVAYATLRCKVPQQQILSKTETHMMGMLALTQIKHVFLQGVLTPCALSQRKYRMTE